MTHVAPEQTLKSDWSLLQTSAKRLHKTTLTELFNKDKSRAKKYTVEVDHAFLDFSKNLIDDESFTLLIQLAKNSKLDEAINRLLSGDIVNTTEKRPALHTALRQSLDAPMIVNDKDLSPLILAERKKMYGFVEKLNNHSWLGVTGKPITDVVNLGIGGSDLGPVMAVQALKPYHCSPIRIHFVSNIDPEVIETELSTLNPETTLFVISSKSFTTPETLANAQLAKAWLNSKLSTQDLSQHFIAITANNEKAIAFGVHAEHILNFWDWVGGRYSIWSSIGFPLALSIGPKNFDRFLEGARSMDMHFANAAFEKNMPVILALLGIWYNNFWDAHSIAILPYQEGLKSFPDYLQQLDMESNGKRANLKNDFVTYHTGPIVWGHAGTKGQHAFYQLLHQGTHLVPIDFILFSKTRGQNQAQHLQLIANGLAQSAALMSGYANTEFAHEHMPGNKPSNTLLFAELSPFALGQLIALYEHKVFVQGVIWQINSFDQPGVELGKKMAKKVIEAFNKQDNNDLDASTQQLIEKIRS